LSKAKPAIDAPANAKPAMGATASTMGFASLYPSYEGSSRNRNANAVTYDIRLRMPLFSR